MTQERSSRDRLLLICLALCGALAGCAAMVGGAVVQGSLMAVDRRTAGTQVDDQTIGVRAASAVGTAIGDRGHVNVNSYSRVVLITGEVPTEADRAAVEAAVAKVENVRAVLNELAVMPNTTLSQRSNDTIITGKVKAAFVDTPGLQVVSISVVTERGTVFLMGRLTDAEATLAANVARSVGGVQKVVKVFEILTPAEAAALPFPPNMPAAAPAASAPGK
jgi:osmotically-inducible protein OsmY